MKDQKFYVIEEIDVTDVTPKNTKVFISSEPVIYNSSKEVCFEGWAGTTNNIAVYAHGEFISFKDAEDYVKMFWKNFKEAENHNPYYNADESIDTIYKDTREIWEAVQWLQHVWDEDFFDGIDLDQDKQDIIRDTVEKWEEDSIYENVYLTDLESYVIARYEEYVENK